ncbi:MAG: hypothetical protein MK052_03020 [Alphaproteobacteria bacterium]|nr:hypothetical protein [Alphaproteobacteria bacterium]
MKKSLTIMTMAALSACTTLGSVEKEALRDRGIADARLQPKEMHLAYLQCYGLNQSDKKSCRRKAAQLATSGRKDASTWDYILPFDYEAERLGFKAFLQDQGKKCASVNEGPKYNTDSNVYDVICTDGNQYQMRFDGSASAWELVK